MKKLRGFFVFVTAAVFAVCATSCSSDDEQLGPHTKWVLDEKASILKTVDETVKSDNENGIEYAIVDYRSASDYEAGHMKGAVNIPATVQNTDSEKAEFCVKLKEMFPTSTRLYFYGDGKDGNLEYVVPGRASKIGFGRANSIILVGGYDKWKPYEDRFQK
jgi:rhodanese-related sulfurtransferase